MPQAERAAADPSIIYDVINIDGEKVRTLRVTRSQLTFGPK